jgi:hypothetical protein
MPSLPDASSMGVSMTVTAALLVRVLTMVETAVWTSVTVEYSMLSKDDSGSMMVLASWVTVTNLVMMEAEHSGSSEEVSVTIGVLTLYSVLSQKPSV